MGQPVLSDVLLPCDTPLRSKMLAGLVWTAGQASPLLERETSGACEPQWGSFPLQYLTHGSTEACGAEVVSHAVISANQDREIPSGY